MDQIFFQFHIPVTLVTELIIPSDLHTPLHLQLVFLLHFYTAEENYSGSWKENFCMVILALEIASVFLMLGKYCYIFKPICRIHQKG